MTKLIEFFLYGRKNCQLCDEMKLELDNFMSNYQYSCHSIDVDNDPVLQQRYGARIPVLVQGNQELCEAKLDKTTLLQHLESISLSG